MHIAPWMNVSSSISPRSSCAMRSICSSVSSRASTTRLAPIARYTRALSLFVVFACVLT